jgi:hypothetical protein
MALEICEDALLIDPNCIAALGLKIGIKIDLEGRDSVAQDIARIRERLPGDAKLQAIIDIYESASTKEAIKGAG